MAGKVHGKCVPDGLKSQTQYVDSLRSLFHGLTVIKASGVGYGCGRFHGYDEAHMFPGPNSDYL